MVLELLQDMLVNNHLIAAEQKTAAAIVKQIETAEIDEKNEQLRLLLNPTQVRATYVGSSNPILSDLFKGIQCVVRTNRCLRSGRANDTHRS